MNTVFIPTDVSGAQGTTKRKIVSKSVRIEPAKLQFTVKYSCGCIDTYDYELDNNFLFNERNSVLKCVHGKYFRENQIAGVRDVLNKRILLILKRGKSILH